MYKLYLFWYDIVQEMRVGDSSLNTSIARKLAEQERPKLIALRDACLALADQITARL